MNLDEEIIRALPGNQCVVFEHAARYSKERTPTRAKPEPYDGA